MKDFFTTIIAISIFCLSTGTAFSQKKEVYLPEKIWEVPENNDYNDPESRFSYSRMFETKDLVMLWDAGFGEGAPASHSDPDLRFDVNHIMKEGQRFYTYYTKKLKFLDTGSSLSDKYKMLTLVIKDDNSTVYGGGAADSIGVTWMRPARMKGYPYCAFAHELSHSFQFMARADGSGIRGGAIGEMTSQWMLWHVYPDWITIENYHWVDLMKKTHYTFLHETNQYHSPYMFEYWGYRHGDEIIGRLWRETKRDEDMVMSYKRLTGITQEQFNDEVYDACSRFITYDIPRIEKVSRRYANQHSCKLLPAGGGWYRIAKERCPQNYGYNGIRLNAPADGTEIILEFKGTAGEKGYNSINTDKAGWRYGFLAVTDKSKRVYSDVGRDAEGMLTFTTPKNTQYLWLIVTGAPTEHWEHIRDNNPETDEEWPYKIKLTGTKLHAYVLN